MFTFHGHKLMTLRIPVIFALR